MTDAPGKAFEHGSSRELAWQDYVRRCAEGDGGALASLYDETGPLVYSVARNIVLNAEDAEEITLDVYSYVWRSAGAFDAHRGTVSTWLVMLARSRSLDKLRARKDPKINLQVNTTADLLPEQAPSVGGLAAGEQRVLIQRALHQLAPEQRKLIELAFFSGLSHQELSSQLNMPLGTVKTRIRLGICRLRDLIGGVGA